MCNLRPAAGRAAYRKQTQTADDNVMISNMFRLIIAILFILLGCNFYCDDCDDCAV